MEADWHARAAQDFSVRLYGFDSRLRSLDSFEQLKYDGNNSELGDAIATLRERYANHPAAGILVFTDGMSTDALATLSQGESQVPIYPVMDLAATSCAMFRLPILQSRKRPLNWRRFKSKPLCAVWAAKTSWSL